MEKEKMREQKLISLIEKQKESEFVDFKQEFYHKEATQDLIKDVISFANAQSNEEKYIIFGVSDTYNLFDIAYEKIRDISELNQVIKEYCEPFINVEFYRFIYEEKKLLALIIAKNVDRPYLIKKDYQKNGTVMLRAGDIYIRHGAKYGLSLDEAREWFISLREHRNEEEIKKWITDECKCMLNLLCQKNDSDAYITGYKLLTPASKYHSSNRTEDVSKEIYEYLMKGKIVIIDLSVGNATLRDKTSKKIATYIFNKSMDMFTGKDINLWAVL